MNVFASPRKECDHGYRQCFFSLDAALPARLVAGITGWLAGGVVFGVLMQMMGMVAMVVGAESVTMGWVVHLAISAFIGLTYALIFARWADQITVGAVLGLGYGVVWWAGSAVLALAHSLLWWQGRGATHSPW